MAGLRRRIGYYVAEYVAARPAEYEPPGPARRRLRKWANNTARPPVPCQAPSEEDRRHAAQFWRNFSDKHWILSGDLGRQ